MRSWFLICLIVAAGCADTKESTTPDDTAQPVARPAPVPLGNVTATPTAPTFDAPVVVDAERPGGEPVIFVTSKGTLIMAAHPGPTHSSPLVGQADPALARSMTAENMMWRSTDGGTTWTYVGFAGLDEGPRDIAFSISDPDLTEDAAGNLYHVSLYNPGDAAVGLGMSVSADDGVTWSGSPLEPGGDRPWIVARGPQEVFVIVHGHAYRSIDGSDGTRLESAGNSPFSAPDANMQLGPDGCLYHGGFPGMACSCDDGDTWTRLDDNMTSASSPGWMMAEPVFDDAGYLYATWFVGSDVYYGVWAPDGETWIRQWRVTALAGTHVWPWMVAGAEGRIAIVWLGSETAASTGSEAGWSLYAAFIEDAHTASPGFQVVRATDAIHQGVLCQSGVGCAAASDRRLGDFITADIDPEGRLLIASAATVLAGDEQNSGGMWGRPIFVKQATGPFLR